METSPAGGGRAHDPAPIRTTIGQNVQRLRGTQLQETVARAIGVSQSTIAKIEAGERLPSVPVLMRLAAYFGTTLDALVAPPESDLPSTTSDWD